jgi:preprotein translocase subunit SecA
MSRLALAAPSELAIGRPYAERSDREPAWHDRVAEFVIAKAVDPIRRRVRRPKLTLGRIVDIAAVHEKGLRAASDSELTKLARSMRLRLRQRGFTPHLVGEGFALVREAAGRTLGYRHFDVQLMGGWALLQGKLIEMDTGEGKTMVATLPASLVALAGYPVHVITVNDYLAGRDAEEMGPLYRFLGLDVGAVVHGLSRDERRQAYARAVTYCSNKELAFDYLRDRVALAGKGSRLHLSLEKLSGRAARGEGLVLRGLCFGLVDEADSVLVDEARTPLILSSSSGPSDEKEQCELALDLARQLKANDDFAVDLADRTVTLTPAGADTITSLAANLTGIWTSPRNREERVTQALTALLLYARDQHYVVSEEGKVQIVDESTGRVMPDRSWERGLHQLIEVKEGCEPTERRETLARLTYQRLFRRYLRLAGMTGTAREVATEVRRVYGLDVVKIPLNRPLQRIYLPAQLHTTRGQKWQAVADEVERMSGQGRPVLIGTRSVRASEEISAVLGERGIDHALLNAKQDRQEAEVVALAGQPRRVTVATNMAGRGTDIRLGAGIVGLGGLHVILSEFHESQRIDRQFFGRCARQGDPGSCHAITSLEDELFVIYAGFATRIMKHSRVGGGQLPRFFLTTIRWFSQFRAERHNAYIRVQNLHLDRRLERMLAFSGRGE